MSATLGAGRTGAIDLGRLGNVPATYRHRDRVVVPDEPLPAAGALLKWYALHRPEAPAPPAFTAEAQAFLRAEAAAGKVELGYGLGFAILHYSDPYAYLIVGAWRDHQELWETLYARDLRRDGGFVRWRPGVDGPTLCVWELAPVWHERDAWVRFLRSDRDEAAKAAYLADRLAGTV